MASATGLAPARLPTAFAAVLEPAFLAADFDEIFSALVVGFEADDLAAFLAVVLVPVFAVGLAVLDACLRAEVFFADRADDPEATVFLAVVFFDTAFLAVVFFTAVFLAAAFLAPGFLAGLMGPGR